MSSLAVGGNGQAAAVERDAVAAAAAPRTMPGAAIWICRPLWLLRRSHVTWPVSSMMPVNMGDEYALV